QAGKWAGSAVRIVLLVGLFGLLYLGLFTRWPIGGAREAARRMQCSNNLKHIGLALPNYHDDYRSLPPAYIADAEGRPMHSWRVLILPYLEQKSLYDKYDFSEPWNGPNNSKLHDQIIQAFCCPSRPGKQPRTETSYVVVRGAKTAWPD